MSCSCPFCERGPWVWLRRMVEASVQPFSFYGDDRRWEDEKRYGNEMKKEWEDMFICRVTHASELHMPQLEHYTRCHLTNRRKASLPSGGALAAATNRSLE